MKRGLSEYLIRFIGALHIIFLMGLLAAIGALKGSLGFFILYYFDIISHFALNVIVIFCAILQIAYGILDGEFKNV